MKTVALLKKDCIEMKLCIHNYALMSRWIPLWFSGKGKKIATVRLPLKYDAKRPPNW